jgi:hypothetical protein
MSAEFLSKEEGERKAAINRVADAIEAALLIEPADYFSEEEETVYKEMNDLKTTIEIYQESANRDKGEER